MGEEGVMQQVQKVGELYRIPGKLSFLLIFSFITFTYLTFLLDPGKLSKIQMDPFHFVFLVMK